jgi:hypothetical protein
MGSGGGGTQTSTTKQSNSLPGYDIPAAKAYISSLMGLVFPGMTMPADYLPKGWNFGSSAAGGGSGGASGQGGGSGGAGQIQTPPLDPSMAYNFLNPMIGSSPSLQAQYAKNPGSITSTMSPTALNQLSQIYGNLPGVG